MSDRENDDLNSVPAVLLLLARGQRWVADVLETAVEELISAHLLPIMELEIGCGGVTFRLMLGGSPMDPTVSGKAVGDELDLVVGPTRDAHGRVLASAAYDVTVSDPAVLGLVLDPEDKVGTVARGQRAARVTILDTADAQVTVALNRPSRGPITHTLSITGTQAESVDQAVDFDFNVSDSTPQPAPTPAPSPEPAPAPQPAPAISPTGRFAGEATATIESRDVRARGVSDG